MSKILIGITGSIAAIKTISLIHILTQEGHHCKAIITKNGLNFITPISVRSMGAEVFIDDLSLNPSKAMEHINLAKWAEFILMAPATANSMAKLAHGLADNLLISTILASPVKPIIVPAMNQQMWKNPATQRNINTLKESGITIWGPKVGLQACGDNDIGRMLEADEINIKFKQLLSSNLSSIEGKLLDGLILAITAGATREAIDPIRYISNYSSGKMGYAIAEQAIRYGAKVILISGAVNIEPPLGLYKFITVETADDMFKCSEENAQGADIFIGCAAVCDYKPSSYNMQKTKKYEQKITLELIRNPDILYHIRLTHPQLFIVGFAAETENVIENAVEKLKKKGLNMIIANNVSNGRVFNKDMNQVTIINESLCQTVSNYTSKTILAKLILEIVHCNFSKSRRKISNKL